jgi:hypothetical protein
LLIIDPAFSLESLCRRIAFVLRENRQPGVTLPLSLGTFKHALTAHDRKVIFPLLPLALCGYATRLGPSFVALVSYVKYVNMATQHRFGHVELSALRSQISECFRLLHGCYGDGFVTINKHLPLHMVENIVLAGAPR